MKKILTCCFIAILICSCEEHDSQVELILRIGEHKANCTGYEGQTECYLSQEGNKIDTEEWQLFYEHIEGFTYEPGFIYTLVVSKTTLKNPPYCGPPVRYVLVREISKKNPG